MNESTWENVVFVKVLEDHSFQLADLEKTRTAWSEFCKGKSGGKGEIKADRHMSDKSGVRERERERKKERRPIGQRKTDLIDDKAQQKVPFRPHSACSFFDP